MNAEQQVKRNIEICRLYRGGAKLQEIADTVSLTRSRVLQICSSHGLTGQRGRPKVSDEEFVRRHANIAELLNRQCLTLTEIGERVGLTRERVRQIAKRLGFVSGKTRRRICTVRTMLQNDETVRELFRKVAYIRSLGLGVKKLTTKSGHFLTKRILVNSHECLLANFHTNSDGYTTVFAQNTRRFLLHEIADGKWLVLPPMKIHTIVKLDGYMEREDYRKKHNVRQYVNAWDALRISPTAKD